MPCACAGLRRPLPTNALLTQSQAQIKCREQRRKVKSLRNVTDRTNYENDAVNKTLEKGEPDLSSRFDCTVAFVGGISDQTQTSYTEIAAGVQ